MTPTQYDPAGDVVTVTGPDATSFLQSLLSQDLDPVAVGDSVPALLLQPQGKLIATMYVLHAAGDEWWLCTEAGAGAALAEGLNRFRIRVKVEVANGSDTFDVVALRGEGARASAAAAVDAAAGTHAVEVVWGGEEAVDVVGPSPAVDAARRQLRDNDVSAGDFDDYEAARVHAGIPRLGVDVDGSTIPQEAFLDEYAVSFTKGCFVGQELVCRIDTRGRVNRYLRRLMFDDATPPPGAEIVAGEKVVGTISSAAGLEGLALVRREVVPPAEVLVRWSGGETRAAVAAV